MELNKRMATMMTDEQLSRVKTYCEEILGKYRTTEYFDVNDKDLFELWQDSEDRLDALNAEHEAASTHTYDDSLQEKWWDEITTNQSIKAEIHYRECKEGLKMVCDVIRWREEDKLYGM